MIAIIPARGGSERIPRKNLRLLAGHPLLAYRIAAAKASNCCDEIIVATDDDEIAQVGARYRATILRRARSTAAEPDIAWLRLAVKILAPDAIVALLRPTAPFLTGHRVALALERFRAAHGAHSLRLIRRVREHPGKMWMVQRYERMVPLLPFRTHTGDDRNDARWHSAPTQQLPVIYMQTAGLEITTRQTIEQTDSIAGTSVVPFELPVDSPEAIDINTEADWVEAERLVAAGVPLPAIEAIEGA